MCDLRQQKLNLFSLWKSQMGMQLYSSLSGGKGYKDQNIQLCSEVLGEVACMKEPSQIAKQELQLSNLF